MPRVFVHRLDRDAVVERLRAYARDQLGVRPEVRRVVLIGSLAGGTWSARSDADIVVLIDRSEVPYRHRSPAYAPERGVGAPVETRVYTIDEQESWGPRFQEAVEEGITLFERG
jgi:predicted nucleotidyltransferase